MALSNMATPRAVPQEKLTAVMPGMRTDFTGKAVRNVILLSVPDDEYDLLRPNLELMSLPHHFVMHQRGEKLDFAYFLNEGMASLVVASKDERSVEVGVVGREGMMGTPLAAGLNRAPYRAIMRVSASIASRRMATSGSGDGGVPSPPTPRQPVATRGSDTAAAR